MRSLAVGRRAAFSFAVSVALWAGPARAVDLFINGENVTGIAGVSLVNARVRIDERGNVHVEAPGYMVRRVDVPQSPGVPRPTPPAASPSARVPPAPAPPPPAPQAPALSHRYYIVARETTAGMSQFDIEVFVNGTSIARVRSGGDAVIDLINRHLRVGQNEVRLVARKNLEGGRRSESASHALRVLIGEGAESNGQVSLQSTLVDWSVNASQASDTTAVFTIQSR